MALYRYIKKDNTPLTIRYSSFLRFLSIFLMIAGLGLFGSVVYPVFSYQVLTSVRFQPKLISPAAGSTKLFQPAVLGQAQDLTLMKNWFPRVSESIQVANKITDYTLSIPSLKIIDASVKIGGDNLKESAIHYPGSGLPGENGGAVIFGHSTLPQFFNTENPLTIFSTLPTIEKGDEIIVNFDGIEYHYRVYEMAEVSPEDVSILEQRYDHSYLTLITCVPPGTYWKRLAVRARLQKI